jgi:transcriptional regulator with XRE-family HTH domain
MAAFLRTLGKRVRLLRLIRELTQDELAQAAGMSRSFVSLIEKARTGWTWFACCGSRMR